MTATIPSDNAVRWERGRTGGHVESYFLKATSPDGRRALWIKHTLFSPVDLDTLSRAEMWIVVFERGKAPRGAKQSIPIGHASLRSYPFSLAMGECWFDAKTSRGRIGDFKWQLSIENRGRSFRPFPKSWMYEGSFPRTKLVTPTPTATVKGTLEIAGEVWDLSQWNAAQGHNWGVSHAEQWAWSHCSDFTGARPGTWFEAVSARVRMAGMKLPWMSIAGLHHDGVTHRFDSMTSWVTSSAKSTLSSYDFEFRGASAKVRGHVEASRDEFAVLRYENPEGPARSCLNSKLARGTLEITLRGSAPFVLESDRFALELGVPEDAHDLPTLL